MVSIRILHDHTYTTLSFVIRNMATMPRCLWAPHTQTQMHGVRRCRFAPINLGTGPAALLTVRLSVCLSRHAAVVWTTVCQKGAF